MSNRSPHFFVSRKLIQSIFILIFLLALISCTAPPQLDSQPGVDVTSTPTESPPVETVEEAPPQISTLTLTIWIPPEFAPGSDNPGGELLQERLDEFSQRRSNVRIVTRIKAVDGTGGIIDTLSTAGAAAPIALPDLVALPSPSLENAAIKGLLQPLDGLTNIMNEADWFNFADQISTLEGSTFGIPIAGDVMLMVYRPSAIQNLVQDWNSLLNASTESSASIAFPAADPNSFFTLLQYQSIGGLILDSENRPTLEISKLTDVLDIYHQAQQSSLIPFWITQYETDDQSWAAYEEKQTDMVITWSSRYLQNLPVDSAGTYVPTIDGEPFTLATGWAWALATNDPERQEISTQLAEFLSTAEFLTVWTAASGYIPPRSNALDGWENVSTRRLIEQIAPSAIPLPSMDVLTTLGPVLQGATVDILKNQADPTTAGEAAVDLLTNP